MVGCSDGGDGDDDVDDAEQVQSPHLQKKFSQSG